MLKYYCTGGWIEVNNALGVERERWRMITTICWCELWSVPRLLSWIEALPEFYNLVNNHLLYVWEMAGFIWFRNACNWFWRYFKVKSFIVKILECAQILLFNWLIGQCFFSGNIDFHHQETLNLGYVTYYPEIPASNSCDFFSRRIKTSAL